MLRKYDIYKNKLPTNIEAIYVEIISLVKFSNLADLTFDSAKDQTDVRSVKSDINDEARQSEMIINSIII